MDRSKAIIVLGGGVGDVVAASYLKNPSGSGE